MRDKSGESVKSHGLEASLEVAKVVGAHGVRGALRISFLSGAPVELRAGQVVQLRLEGPREAGQAQVSSGTVARVAEKPGTAMARLWLEEIDSRDAADALRGATIHIDRDALGELDEDEFYLADLIGASVVHAGALEISLGRVEGVVDNGAQDLFEISWQSDGRERRWLMPVVPAYIHDINLDQERLIVDLPSGLLPAELERALQGAVDLGAGPGSESDDGRSPA